jgi:hypothetical protein
MDWDTAHVKQVRWEMLNRHMRRMLQSAAQHDKPVPILLSIDDSVVEKTDKKMESVDYHYSHSVGGMMLGHM